jgi:choline-sulfatase
LSAMKKPNIILFYSDELRTDALGCYGHPIVQMKTPHIDALADMGIQYNQCFCTSPVCVASRTSMLTGLYPEDTGVYHNEAYWPKFKLENPPLTFPEVFAQHGYVTANFGKAHIPRSFSPWNVSEESGGGMHSELDFFYDKIEKYDVVFDRKRPWMIFAGTWPDELSYFSKDLVKNALHWLDTIDQPYLLRISFLQPHTPILVPRPFDETYNPAEFRDSNEWNPNASSFDRLVGEMCISDHQTSENIQLMQAHYYGLTAWVDSQVGMVLDYLRDKRQLDDTILIFESDHGVSLGEGHRYHKLTFAPEVHRVPRIISFPVELPGGKITDELTQSIDLARTLFGLAGIQAPSQFKGRDLFSEPAPEEIYATIGFGWDDSYAAPFAELGRYLNGHGWPRRSCIRTAQYRLDKNVRMDGQPVIVDNQDIFMADYREDPKELKNLAKHPEYQEITEKLSTKLDAHVSNSVEWPEEFVGRNVPLHERNRALSKSILSKKGLLPA